jgi:hypothetical protein
MSTKTFLCFLSLPEFLDIINPIIDSLQLEPILQRLRNQPVQFIPLERPITIEKIKEANADRLYLAIKKTSVESLDPRHFRPSQLGWIQIDFPREQNGVLLITDMGVKTHWYEGDIQYENNDLLKIYNRFINRFKKKLKFPVKGYNIKMPEMVSVDRGIGYGQSAKEFYQNGGELMQEGVNNGRFIIDDE